MGHLYFLLGLGALLLISFGLSLHRRFGRRGRFPYVAATTLFTPAQAALLVALESALGPGYRIFGRVRAVDIIGLRRWLDRATRRRALALLWERRFDFVICTLPGHRIAAAVNLAPASRRGRPPPCDTLDRLCAAAGLPFLRIRAAEEYDPTALRRLLRAAIAAHSPAPVSAPTPAAAAATPASTQPVTRRLEPVHRLPDTPFLDEREPRLRLVQGAAEPSAPAVTSPAPAARVEPVLAPGGELDPEPDFDIGGQFDDDEERPRRIRRR